MTNPTDDEVDDPAPKHPFSPQKWFVDWCKQPDDDDPTDMCGKHRSAHYQEER